MEQSKIIDTLETYHHDTPQQGRGGQGACRAADPGTGVEARGGPQCSGPGPCRQGERVGGGA